MPRYCKFVDSGYMNHEDSMEENESMRIDFIIDNPRYNTREEYEEVLDKLEDEIRRLYDETSNVLDTLEREYGNLCYEYAVLYGT